MLLGSDWILNRAMTEYEIFPFIHQRINLKSQSDIVEAIVIPDEFPTLVLEEYTEDDNGEKMRESPGAFSMVAGDFLTCYSDDVERGIDHGSFQPGSWDVLVTSYFIDTANNIINYMERIYQLLKEGGCWINYGPLLYHFDGHPTEESIELPLDEVLSIAKQIGFKLQNDLANLRFLRGFYCQLGPSMMKTEYENAFFVAFK